MANDWIKMRAGLSTHPKVVRIASALQADRLRVVGGLHSVWCLFDEHSTNGSLHGYTLDALDDLIGWPGFAAAMVRVEWLVESGETLTTPRFEDHNGQSAKRRAQDADRKRMSRENPQDVVKMSACEADKMRTREEKRREEKSKTKPTSKADAFATRLPTDWVPDESQIEFCKTERPDLKYETVVARFRDYWVAVPGAKGRKTDWPATWRNWVRNEKAQARASPSAARTPEPDNFNQRDYGSRALL